MVLKCQVDSFLKEFTTKVESCLEAQFTVTVDGKPVKKKGFAVQLEDTIIFPEGGGQPSDDGSIGSVEVLHSERKGDGALHYTLQPVNLEDSVKISINWEKRFDHMQQHSGQHLLSAILEKEFDLPTTSWWLGEKESYVELATTTLASHVLSAAEERCNQLIREALPVTLTICDKDDPNLDKAHTRGLPADHVGLVRIISIKGIDDNLCCGTHVTNLSQLQVLKLLGAEAGKKNKTNLRFLVGGRVLSRLQLSLDREQTLTKILNNDAGRHAELVEKLQSNAKVLRRGEGALLDEFCPLLLSDCLQKSDKLMLVHRALPTPPALIPALSRLIQASSNPPYLAMLSHADGTIVMLGDEKAIADLAPKICENLKAKGGGNGKRYQAKGTNMTSIDKCHNIVKEYFEQNVKSE